MEETPLYEAKPPDSPSHPTRKQSQRAKTKLPLQRGTDRSDEMVTSVFKNASKRSKIFG
jgi:hypothetical protein